MKPLHDLGQSLWIDISRDPLNTGTLKRYIDEHRGLDSPRIPQMKIYFSACRSRTSRANHRAAQTGPQQVASTHARALAAVADVQQKRAALEQAELNLQYTKIVAPVSGEVNKNVVVGLNVQPGQQLPTIVPLGEVWITANFKETQLKA